MQIGCGVYEHVVHGRAYLYFWHYEAVAGRRRQVKEYLGSAEDEQARAEAAHRVDAYFRKASRELEHVRKDTLGALARPRSAAASRRVERP